MSILKSIAVSRYNRVHITLADIFTHFIMVFSGLRQPTKSLYSWNALVTPHQPEDTHCKTAETLSASTTWIRFQPETAIGFQTIYYASVCCLGYT